MKIGVDISQTAHQGSGVNRFTRSLINSLLKFDKQNRYTFFFSSMRQNLDEKIEKAINSSVVSNKRNELLWLISQRATHVGFVLGIILIALFASLNIPVPVHFPLINLVKR